MPMNVPDQQNFDRQNFADTRQGTGSEFQRIIHAGAVRPLPQAPAWPGAHVWTPFSSPLIHDLVSEMPLHF